MELSARASRAGRSILVLDYDGTLLPFAPVPELAEPDEALLGLLARLAGRYDPFVLLTAFGDDVTHARAAALGVELLDKPVSMAQVRAAVARAIERRAATGG